MSALEFSEIFLKIPKHIRGNVHKCQNCRRYCSNSIFFISNHVRRHNTTLKPFNCQNEIEKYLCKDCNFTTDHVLYFRQHIKNCHKTENNQLTSYICEKCSFQTYSKLVWIKHRKKQTCLKCHSCNSNFKTIDLLKEHLKTYKSPQIIQKGHNFIRWFHCENCGFKTKYLRSLIKHQSSKHLIKALKCSKCYFKTGNTDAFLLHMEIHKQSEDETSLVSHLTKQQNNQCFTCYLCHFTFKTIEMLEKHRELHERRLVAIGWIKCEHCPFKSKSQHNLIEHAKNMHTMIHRKRRRAKAKSGHCTNNKKLKLLQCNQCSFKTKSFLIFKCHEIVHKNDHYMKKYSRSPIIRARIISDNKMKKESGTSIQEPVIGDHEMQKYSETPVIRTPNIVDYKIKKENNDIMKKNSRTPIIRTRIISISKSQKTT